MNKNELKALCETACKAVTGRRVTVRLEPPVTRQFEGEVYYKGGGYTININPELSDEDFLYVLCHEMGHVKMNHVSDIPPDRKPRSMELTPAGELSLKLKPEILQRESDAQSWGTKLQHFAVENAHYYSGMTLLERQLRALGGYVLPVRKVHSGLKSIQDRIELDAWKHAQLKKGR
jgi:hypothetical protein